MGLSQTCEIKLKNKFQRGNRNLITDIPGVRVGQVTLQNAEKAIHTGVTVILPHGGNLFKEKVPAGVSIINGFGKSAGLIQVHLGERQRAAAIYPISHIGSRIHRGRNQNGVGWQG